MPERRINSLTRTGLRVCAACLLGAGVAIGAGCSAIGFFAVAAHEAGSTKVFAEYEGLAGHDFAVIVQADQVLRANDPRLVNRITNAVTNMLSTPEVGATGVVPGPLVLEFQYSNPSWPSWSYDRLLDEFTVDRLVVIDLYEYRLNEPGNRHVWEGRAAARVSVAERERGGEEFAFTRDVQVRFPDEMGMTRTEIRGEAVAQGLEVRLVNRIGWLFFDHEEPNTIEY